MKKALITAAVVLASTSAFASKARLDALGNAAHLSDARDVLAKPDRAAAFGDWALMEMGPNSSAVATNVAGTTGYTATTTSVTAAEGGFVRTMGQAAMGAFLGAPNVGVNHYRQAFDFTIDADASDADVLRQENPIRLFYAAKADGMTWGVGLFHTSSKNKTSSTVERKQDAMGLTASASTDVWDARLALGLSNNASQTLATGENKLTGKSTATLAGGYKMDTMYIYGEYSMSGAKGDNTASTTIMDRGDNKMAVGIVNSHKKDGTDFFYGIEYASVTLKDDATTPTSLGTDTAKSEITTMPVIVGIEAEAASWLVFRGSVKQDFNLLGMNKIKNSMKANTANDTERVGADNTVIGAGLGMKWNKWMFDGTLQGSATGSFGLDANFLAKAAMTYTF